MPLELIQQCCGRKEEKGGGRKEGRQPERKEGTKGGRKAGGKEGRTEGTEGGRKQAALKKSRGFHLGGRENEI